MLDGKQRHCAAALPATGNPPLPLVSIKELHRTDLPSVNQLPMQPILTPDTDPLGKTGGARYLSCPWRWLPASAASQHS